MSESTQRRKFKVGDYVKSTNLAATRFGKSDNPWAKIVEYKDFKYGFHRYILDRQVTKYLNGLVYSELYLEKHVDKRLDQWKPGDIVERIAPGICGVELGKRYEIKCIEGSWVDLVGIEQHSSRDFPYTTAGFRWISGPNEKHQENTENDSNCCCTDGDKEVDSNSLIQKQGDQMEREDFSDNDVFYCDCGGESRQFLVRVCNKDYDNPRESTSECIRLHDNSAGDNSSSFYGYDNYRHATDDEKIKFYKVFGYKSDKGEIWKIGDKFTVVGRSSKVHEITGFKNHKGIYVICGPTCGFMTEYFDKGGWYGRCCKKFTEVAGDRPKLSETLQVGDKIKTKTGGYVREVLSISDDHIKASSVVSKSGKLNFLRRTIDTEFELVSKKEDNKFEVGQNWKTYAGNLIEITKVDGSIVSYSYQDGDESAFNENSLFANDLRKIEPSKQIKKQQTWDIVRNGTLTNSKKEQKMIKNVASKTCNFAKNSAKNVLWNWPLTGIKKALWFSIGQPACTMARPAKYALQGILFSAILGGSLYSCYYLYQNGRDMYDNIKIPTINVEWDSDELKA